MIETFALAAIWLSGFAIGYAWGYRNGGVRAMTDMLRHDRERGM